MIKATPMTSSSMFRAMEGTKISQTCFKRSPRFHLQQPDQRQKMSKSIWIIFIIFSKGEIQTSLFATNPWRTMQGRIILMAVANRLCSQEISNKKVNNMAAQVDSKRMIFSQITPAPLNFSTPAPRLLKLS